MNDSTESTDKYQLLAELGHGGMADVFLGVLQGPRGFRKLAVLKRLRSHLAEDPEFLAMFLQEARIAARLSHPNVVQTFEVGHDGQHHFIAMEYLQGRAMNALLARVGRAKLDLAVQIKIIIETLEGLAYVHELKDFDGTPLSLVHRDISPQNIFITYDGQVKVLDFGIAKALDSAVETRTGIIKGKLAYMSPEQACAKPIDGRGDLYSLGVVLWEALAGRRRWKGLSSIQMMKELTSRRSAEQLPVKPPGVPATVLDVVKRAIAYDPAERFESAHEFRAALEGVLEEMGARVSNRELGELMKQAFKKDRERLEEIIQEELKKLEHGKSSAPAAAELVQLDTAVSGRPSSAPSRPPSSPALPTKRSATYSRRAPSLTPTGVEAPPTVPDPPAMAAQRKPARKWPAAVAAVSLAVAAAAVAFIGVTGRRGDLAAGKEVASPATPAMVKVRLAATPAESVLYLNGKKLGPSPYQGELPFSTADAEIRIDSPGYLSKTEKVSLTRDLDLHFSLEPEPTEPASSKKKKKRAVRYYYRPWMAKKKPGEAESAEKQAEEKQPTPEVKPVPPRSKPGVVLDTDNPWK